MVNMTAQFHEIGAFVGFSNYVGDVGTDRYVNPNSPAFGLVYKWNATDRYSLRAGFSFTNSFTRVLASNVYVLDSLFGDSRISQVSLGEDCPCFFCTAASFKNTGA